MGITLSPQGISQAPILPAGGIGLTPHSYNLGESVSFHFIEHPNSGRIYGTISPRHAVFNNSNQTVYILINVNNQTQRFPSFGLHYHQPTHTFTVYNPDLTFYSQIIKPGASNAHVIVDIEGKSYSVGLVNSMVRNGFNNFNGLLRCVPTCPDNPFSLLPFVNDLEIVDPKLLEKTRISPVGLNTMERFLKNHLPDNAHGAVSQAITKMFSQDSVTGSTLRVSDVLKEVVHGVIRKTLINRELCHCSSGVPGTKSTATCFFVVEETGFRKLVAIGQHLEVKKGHPPKYKTLWVRDGFQDQIATSITLR